MAMHYTTWLSSPKSVYQGHLLLFWQDVLGAPWHMKLVITPLCLKPKSYNPTPIAYLQSARGHAHSAFTTAGHCADIPPLAKSGANART